jgi:hypothetical protein
MYLLGQAPVTLHDYMLEQSLNTKVNNNHYLDRPEDFSSSIPEISYN